MNRSEEVTRRIVEALDAVMTDQQLKLEYVASSAQVGFETARRVRMGRVKRLQDHTAHKLAGFIERETEGKVTATDLLDLRIPWDPNSDRLRQILEEIPDGIYVVQDDRVCYCNSRLLSMVGYTLEEIRRLPLENTLTEDGPAVFEARGKRRLEGEVVEDPFIIEIVRKDGSTFFAEVRDKEIVYEGRRAFQGCLREVCNDGAT